MNEFKMADELSELSKNDRAIIVGSEIRGAIQELRNGIERRDKLIEQMRIELKGFVDILRILTRNSDKSPSNEFTIAMITCIGRNELLIEAALSAAERIKE